MENYIYFEDGNDNFACSELKEQVQSSSINNKTK